MEVSNNELARRLAPEMAEHKVVENKRSQVRDWSKSGVHFTDVTAERLADALSKPADYFKVPRPARTRPLLAEQVSALRDVVIELAEREGLPVPDVLRQAADGEAA